MGYTHYFYYNNPFEVLDQEIWDKFIDYVKRIIQVAKATDDIDIVGPMGEKGTKPEIDGDIVSLNGLEDDSHETLLIDRDPTEESQRQVANMWTGKQIGFRFCKTNQKPYDSVVTAILFELNRLFPGKFTVSSDGDRGDEENPDFKSAIVNKYREANHFVCLDVVSKRVNMLNVISLEQQLKQIYNSAKLSPDQIRELEELWKRKQRDDNRVLWQVIEIGYHPKILCVTYDQKEAEDLFRAELKKHNKNYKKFDFLNNSTWKSSKKKYELHITGIPAPTTR